MEKEILFNIIKLYKDIIHGEKPGALGMENYIPRRRKTDWDSKLKKIEELKSKLTHQPEKTGKYEVACIAESPNRKPKKSLKEMAHEARESEAEYHYRNRHLLHKDDWV